MVRKPAVETLRARGNSHRHLRRRANHERLLADPVDWMNDGQEPPSGATAGRERDEPAWSVEFDFLRALRALQPEERLRIAADLAAPAERHGYLTPATWAH